MQLRSVAQKVFQLYYRLIDLCIPYPVPVYYVRALIEAEEYDKARELLLRKLKSRDDVEEPNVIDYTYTLHSLSLTWSLANKYQEAISFFSEYIRRYPGDVAAYVGLATALWYSGQLEQAISDFSRALELKPDDILSLSSRGQVLAEIGQNKRALEDLNTALELLKIAPRPNWSWGKWYEQIEGFVRRGRGVALAGLGEHALAMAEFDLSITLCPENAWVYYDRACMHDIAESPEKASTDYQMALAKNNPRLNPNRQKRAEERLAQLLGP